MASPARGVSGVRRSRLDDLRDELPEGKGSQRRGRRVPRHDHDKADRGEDRGDGPEHDPEDPAASRHGR